MIGCEHNLERTIEFQTAQTNDLAQLMLVCPKGCAPLKIPIVETEYQPRHGDA